MAPLYDLFLSYSAADKDWVRGLATRIEQETWNGRPLNVFFDEWDIPPGANIPHYLEQAIGRSRHIGIVFSPNSVSSEWVLLERSLAKWSDPSGSRQLIIPLLLHPCTLPASDAFLRYIDFTDPTRLETGLGQLLATLRHEALPRGHLRAGTDLDFDWDPLLSKIEADQFTESPKSHQYGGWSKAYALSYLPLAFPDQLPPTVSSGDSVTVTHWIVRGLCSLRRMTLEHRPQDSNSILKRLERLLSLARLYLMNHFDGRGAGLFRSSAEGDVIKLDVRHSAAFVKAMLQLDYGQLEAIRQATSFALHHFDLTDQLLSSYAEVYHLIGLGETHPDLLHIDVSPERLREITSDIETKLLQHTHHLRVGNSSATLLGHSKQLHMLPHYSWWILDACGTQMAKSDDARIRRLLTEVLLGLDQLRIVNDDGSVAYPLSLDGPCDIGTSAQIGELLIRFRREEYLERADSVAAYLRRSLAPNSLSEYVHHDLLWAVPSFFEAYVKFKYS